MAGQSHRWLSRGLLVSPGAVTRPEPCTLQVSELIGTMCLEELLGAPHDPHSGIPADLLCTRSSPCLDLSPMALGRAAGSAQGWHCQRRDPECPVQRHSIWCQHWKGLWNIRTFRTAGCSRAVDLSTADQAEGEAGRPGAEMQPEQQLSQDLGASHQLRKGAWSSLFQEKTVQFGDSLVEPGWCIHAGLVRPQIPWCFRERSASLSHPQLLGSGSRNGVLHSINHSPKPNF
ncbi:uncharacterized protein LOC128812745 isoform X3 [Vidua macroura]|uniref:uncharacterized protein LOC128812745 isoform X3 n=1 Tax=Vidua macroura TaxID=187451 RepID=UPI0023A85D22|nr:uncharacterized protein LOC128812745 isoform X3 [Vidua macroura]